MGMLTRLKRRELEGFKEFVCNLETTPESRRKEILQLAALEDPLYTSWVIKNITTINSILKLSSDQIDKVLKTIPNGINALAKAFYNSEQIPFIKEQVLSRYMLSDFEEYLVAISALKKSEQEGSQFLILKVVRELQRKGEIEGPFWSLPPIDLMNEEKMTSFNGEVEIKFDNGAVAAKGTMLKSQRHGIWEHYFESAQIMARGFYRAGLKNGNWEFWYLNGKVKAKGAFKDDNKHGEWHEYDQTGTETLVKYEQGKKLT